MAAEAGDQVKESPARGGPARPRAPAALRGGVGPLAAYKVHGWAYDPAAPAARLEAELLLDGEPIGTTQAALFRQDLVTAGIGDGNYGFAFNTDRKIPVDAPERVLVRVRNPETGLSFELKPRQPGAPKPAAAAPRPAPAAAAPAIARATLPADVPERPVFVLGAARSGTSAMAQALFRNTRYVGHGEGHLLDMAPHLLRAVDRHYRERAGERRPGINTMIAAVEPERMVAAIGAGLSSLTRSLFPGGYWLDKTPGVPMLEAVPALLRLWPEARFIFMRRRAIENLASRGRKFPKEGFEVACRRWADCLRSWEAVRGDLAGRAIEVDWLLMAREPERVAPAVSALLSLDEAETQRFRQALQMDLPERTSDRFAEVLDGLPPDMDAEQRRIFAEISAPWMERAGYDDTARYWREGQEGRALVVL